MSKKMHFLISLVLLLSLAGNALAYDTINWDNDSGDRLWQTVANWQVGRTPQEQLPLAKDWVVIEDFADANNGPIINADTNAVCLWLDMGYYAPIYDEAVLTMTGGSLTVGDWMGAGYYQPGSYRFDISGGTLYVGANGFTVGRVADSYVTFNMSGGTFNCEDFLSIGIANTSQADMNMTGGDVNLGGWFEIGSYDTRPGKGHVNLHGGTIETILLAMGGGGVGTMDLAGGTLIIDGDYRVPNGWLFDPCSDTATDDDPAGYTGTIAILADRGLITAYNTNIGDIITDVNYPSVVGLRAVVNLDYDVTNPGQTTITAGAVDPNLAWNPDPLFGSGGVVPPDLISWAAGENAASHQVYFGTGFTGVDSADTTDTTGIYKATQPLDDTNHPVSTTWHKTYYWRIDEVNGATTWKGTVWNFATPPAWAKNPSPGNNATGVSPTAAILSWEPGPEAATHNVYFSSVFNDVNEREPSVMTVVSDPCYTPGDLDLDKLYYWTTDEVNNSEDPNIWPGPVWRFRTADYITVDNFESYVNNDALWAVWDDYWTNYTGSEIFVEADASFVRSGDKSLKYDYACGAGYETVGSRIDADAVDLEIGTDWTYGGAEAMQLFFRGDPSNSATENDRMWVELEDTSNNTGVVIYGDSGEDPNNVKKDTWTTWHIDLALFDACGVSLPNIDKVHIGFGGPQGGQSSAGGSGTVHFDDLRLRPPYCRSGLVISDITGDCVTDELDLRLMAGDWLEYDYNVPAVPISGAPVGWWKFDEGMGLTTEDSSTYNNDGDITHASWTVGYPNDPCDSALHFDGDGIAQYDKVVCAELKGNSPGIYPAELMPAAFTVACWTKLDSFEYYGALVAGGNDDDASDQCGFYLYGNGSGGTTGAFGLGIRTEARMYWLQTSGIYDTDTWYHVAATYDEDANTVSIYVDGKLMLGPTNVGGPIRYISAYSESYPDYFSIGGLSLRDSEDWYYANGTIDEARLYDYAMPHGEVVTLAEQPAAYQEVTSAANIYDLEAKLSKKVNSMDFAVMADHWLEGPTLWP